MATLTTITSSTEKRRISLPPASKDGQESWTDSENNNPKYKSSMSLSVPDNIVTLRSENSETSVPSNEIENECDTNDNLTTSNTKVYITKWIEPKV